MLERYLAKYEFKAKYIIGASDCETFAVNEILSRKELMELHSLRLGYSEAQGNPSLRKEIATLFRNVSHDEIVVAVPQESIFITMNALLNPGDKVIVQVPCYQSLCAIPRAIGTRVITWSPLKTNEQWCWDLDFLKKNVDKSTKLIVVNSPQNPTGSLFTRAEFTEIIEIAKENDCYLLSDEMYRLLEHREEERLPTGSDVYEKCISLSGLSKTFGLGGLRIGWLSIRDKTVLDTIVKLKDYTTLSNSALSEYVALIALRKKDTLLARNLGIIRSNLQLLDKFFTRHTDKFNWRRPNAGSVAFVETRLKVEIDSFCEDLVNKKGVLLVPGTKFGYGQNYFRIGFGRKNLPDALELFEEFVNEMKGLGSVGCDLKCRY